MAIFPKTLMVTILTGMSLLMWSSQCVATDCEANGLDVHVYYILPESTANSSCPAFPCETLDHYANVSHDLENNSCLFFLPGLHELSKTFALNNLHLIQLVGGYSGNYSLLRNGSSSYKYHRPQVFCNCTDTSIGFIFQNINYLSIQNLDIISCGQTIQETVHRVSMHVQAAVTLKQVFALSMSSVIIANSSGFGLVAEGVYGNSSISDCHFLHNAGNVAILYSNCPLEYTASQNNLTIFDSSFMHGYTNISSCDICDSSIVQSSGLVVHMSCTNVYMYLSNAVFGFNKAYGNSSKGGNLHITFHSKSYHINNSVVIENSTIMHGKAVIGGGVYIKYSLTPSKTNQSLLACENNIIFRNTNFTDNSGSNRGGAMFVTFIEGDMVDGCPVGHVSIENCSFTHNRLSNSSGDAGAAIGVFTILKNGVLSTSPPYLTVHIKNNQFVNNMLHSPNKQSNISTGAIVYIGKCRREIFITNSTFESNQGTAISVYRSNIVFQGHITIRNNIGIYGGGLVICEGSYILLSGNTNLIFEHNVALHVGGAIFVEDDYLEEKYKYSCIFQIYEEQTPSNLVMSRDLILGEVPATHSNLQMDINSLLDTIHIIMINNTAKHAGSQIYGGSMDYCMVIVNQKKFRGSFYDRVFNESQWKYNHTDLSYVTSNARYACFCDENHKVMCDLKRISLIIYPGESFTVSVVAVGQFQHPVPATIVANISSTGTFHQTIHHKCTQLNFTINSKRRHNTLALSVSSSDGYVAKEGGSMIFIDFSYRDCLPWLPYDSNTCTCNVSHVLQREGFSFNPKSNTLSRPGGTFVELVSNQLKRYKNCPSHYCNASRIEIYLNETYLDSQSQCIHSRDGRLCGRCQDGLSEAIASSLCLVCKYNSIQSHVFVIVLAYIAISVLVVFFLVFFNITITDGTLNGLIFYLNIFSFNRQLFVPNSTHETVLTEVVSAINLDIGLRACFYDGFDGFGRTFVQLFTPALMWIIAGIIVFTSSRSSKIAALVGKNAVKMLATLFLLSYSKVLQVLVAVLSCSAPHHNAPIIWLRDGNVECWQGKHIILVSIGVFFAIFTILYTLILVFVQPLQRYSHVSGLKWFAKLKPFIDAYTCPHVIKDQYRFWTGLLLLFRILCVLAIASMSRFNEPERNFAVVIFICSIVLTLMCAFSGIYKRWWLNCLNSFFYLNLVFLAIMTWYATEMNRGPLQQSITTFSLCITFLAFILIVIYKVHNTVKTTRVYSKCMAGLSNSSFWSCLVSKYQKLREGRGYQRIPQGEDLESDEVRGSPEPDQELQDDFGDRR